MSTSTARPTVGKVLFSNERDLSTRNHSRRHRLYAVVRFFVWQGIGEGEKDRLAISDVEAVIAAPTRYAVLPTIAQDPALRAKFARCVDPIVAIVPVEDLLSGIEGKVARAWADGRLDTSDKVRGGSEESYRALVRGGENQADYFRRMETEGVPIRFLYL